MDFVGRIRIKSPVLHVTDNTNDLAFQIEDLDIDVLADCVLTGKGFSGELFIDVHSARTRLSFLLADESTSKQRDAGYFEVVRRNTVKQSQIHLAALGRLGSPFYPVPELRVVAAERSASEHYTCRLNARDGTQPVRG